MKKRILFIGIIIFILGGALWFGLKWRHTKDQKQVSQREEDVVTSFPEAPTGFSWQECGHMQASFLKPAGWYFHEDIKKDTVACFITKEEIVGQTGEFQTGLSVNAVKQIPQKTGMQPTVYAKQFIANAKQYTLLGPQNEIEVGPLKGYGQTVESQSRGYGAITQYILVLGNDQTGTVYIMWYESPKTTWDTDWKIGFVMMENLALAGEF